jgi:hypothetical protein
MPARFAVFPIHCLPELASLNFVGIRFVCSITFNLLIIYWILLIFHWSLCSW